MGVSQSSLHFVRMLLSMRLSTPLPQIAGVCTIMRSHKWPRLDGQCSSDSERRAMTFAGNETGDAINLPVDIQRFAAVFRQSWVASCHQYTVGA